MGAGLALYLLTRLTLVLRVPLDQFYPLYPHTFSVSLSLLRGDGFARLRLDPRVAGGPIQSFLDLRSEALSPEDLRAARQAPQGSVGAYPYVDGRRTLHILFATTVWRLTGVGWRALSVASLCLSLFALLAVLSVIARIHCTAAILALALYSISAWEAMMTLNARDSALHWFAALTVLGLLAASKRRERWSRWLLVGAISTVGYAWKTDALMLAPFALLGSVALAASAAPPGRKRWVQGAVAGAACLAGAAIPLLVVRLANPLPRGAPATMPAHVAYFGGQARSTSSLLENRLQIARDDSRTASDVAAWLLRRQQRPATMGSAPYGPACVALYLESWRLSGGDWLRSLPGFLVRAAVPPEQYRWSATSFATRAPLLAAALDSWGRHLLPCLALLGCLAALWGGAHRRLVLTALSLFLYSALVWFAVDPHERHWGPIFLALVMLAAMAPYTFLLARSSRPTRRSVKALVLVVATAATCWVVATSIAALVAERAWRAAETSIARLHARSTPFAVLRGRRLAVLEVPTSRANVSRMVFVKVRSDGPAQVVVRQLRFQGQQELDRDPWTVPMTRDLHEWTRRTLWWNAFLLTRHPVPENTASWFAFTFERVAAVGDRRACRVEISVEGEAAIEEVRHAELGGWTGLQLATFVGVASRRWTAGGEPSSEALSQFPWTPDALRKLGMEMPFEEGERLLGSVPGRTE